jgi:acyl-CoA thioesterase I
MSATGKRALASLAWAGAAVFAAAVLAPAHAEMRAAARVLPSPTEANPATSLRTIAPAAREISARPAALQHATAPIEPSPAACGAGGEYVHFVHPLVRTARRLATGQVLTIVAIGSSSTAGAGASSAAASYPSRLALELRKRFPGHEITVLNRGVNGEETPQMLARFATGVIAAHPQLVLWQIGTNSILRDLPLALHSTVLREGIGRLKAIGADVVLIDPQYAPKVLRKPEAPEMVEQIARAASEENVDLFRRFAVMHEWYQSQHHSFAAFVSADGLHMNDWGYACWAKLLARAIADAANSPLAEAVP